MHTPVLLSEVLKYLNVNRGEKFIDGTVGDGGYAQAILESNKKAKVLGIDLDQASLSKLRERFAERNLDQRFEGVSGNYAAIGKIAQAHGFAPASGVVLDLGFSSGQVDDPRRGFSFQTEGPLDMRYDQSQKRTAAEIINFYSSDRLEKIIREFGEERYSRNIAKKIIAARETDKIETTGRLAQIIRRAVPPGPNMRVNDSVRRVFQALRIEVNDELDNLRQALPQIMDILTLGGRVVVLSFHSLEDRIVKEFFKFEVLGCVCPKSFPECVCGKIPRLAILTKKPVTALEPEIGQNPRSKPAKLRAAEKIGK